MEAPPQVIELEGKLVDSLQKLSAEIILARNELAALARAREDYLKARDQEARKRIARVYQAAKDALSEAGGYLSTIECYTASVRNIVTEVKAIRQRVNDDRLAYEDEVAITEAALDKNAKELSELTIKLRGERALIEGERAQLGRERTVNAAEKERLASERYSLAVALKELKDLSTKL